MNPRQVLGLFGLRPGTRRVCPGGPECMCGRAASVQDVDLREHEEVDA